MNGYEWALEKLQDLHLISGETKWARGAWQSPAQALLAPGPGTYRIVVKDPDGVEHRGEVFSVAEGAVERFATDATTYS